ncbi:hypothetical protein EW026_g2433 [Hermanssonia centrifuga]|uniref:Uncharacterized protein n=1 Tax=Hermanssonia centrifuga TaxID=98765 RepID=A0A4S4KND0_9APHY|nr:hypothetical protein EW026_g2433 [Hermanssonia centrifuga]
MPGPGKRKTGKSKKAGGSGAGRDLSNVDISTVLDSYIDEINDTEGWETVVRFLCRMFDLPDLETRSGLTKIHNNFPQIQKNLQAAYTKYEGNAKITGGIAGIWARMSIDVILRDRLFREGLISKMIPLLDVRATRYVGLQALSTVTHHGGVEVRHEIAKYTSTLLRLMEEFPDDSAVNDLVIVTLAHAVGSVITDDNVQAHTIRELDMPTVLRLTMVNIRKPDAPHYMLSHALQLLSCSTLHCYREVKAIPSLVKLLVASLRSADLTVRCSSLGGLVRLFHNECERDLHVKDPQKFMAAIQRGFPDNLSDLLMAHDPTKCDTYVILQTSADYQKAMMRCVQDHDLYALGKTLAGLILKTEFAIAEGGFQAYNERTGQPEIMDVGLPFKMWSDSLPICAKAVRAKGTPKDLDMADILDIKFFIMRQRIPEAADLAKRAIERSPQVAYFYYAISLAAELTQGLRAAKKGLKCKQITPFVRANLLWRCVCHAGDLGLTRLQMAAPGDTAYSEGIAFLVSALDDAKTFTSEIPPDSRHHINILNWLILLTIALRGSELSPDLRELDVGS